ncbi:MAG: DcaP family trimeric outer membrane transporter [Pseudomonadales bacterium]
MRKERGVQTRSLVLAIVLALAKVIAVYAAAPPDQLCRLPSIEEKLAVVSGYSVSEDHGAKAYPHILGSANSCPDRGLSYRFGGYVKLDAIHDFDAIGATDNFNVATIPTDGRPGENSRLHARETRLNMDTRSIAGTRDLRVFVEGDFFNQDETSFRIRHAFAEVGGLTVGQTWTTFMDEGPGPRIVDFENPSGYIIDRRALLRYERRIGDSWYLSSGIEESSLVVTEPAGTTGTTNSLWPDSILRIRWEHSHFHLQTAAIIREFQFQEDVTNDTQSVTGWGFNFSGRAETTERDTSYFEITFGDGIGGFRGVPDAGPDAFGVLEALPAFAWNVAWTHDWSDRFSSNFIFSRAELTNSAGQAGSTESGFQYLATNIIWSAREQVDVGLEYLFGKREDKDGSSGEANRLHLGIWFYLP